MSSRPFFKTAVVLLAAVSFLPSTLSQNLTVAQTSAVEDQLAVAAQHSWEFGTRAQALLEHDASAFSVFSRNSLPPPSSVPSNLASAIAPVFSIAKNIVANRSISNNNTVGPQPFIQDGSAADPASIGVAVLLANWTGQGGEDYAGAAKDQLDFLFDVVPKTSDGAFSHRVSQVQLWSDFVYMVPPFLAYYGVLSQNRTLLMESYTQIQLYRNYLRDANASGIWKHILLGSSGNDEGHWSTGNGWAAAGMCRVLATIQRSQYANTMKSQQSDLASWVKEIHSGMYPLMDSTNIFANYPDRPIVNSSNFYDASSTTLLASTVYRISLLVNDHSHLPFAEKSRKTLFAENSTHFTSDGWLTPVVNPESYGAEGSKSAEGQAFVLELQAAYTDWVAAGSKGANGGVRRYQTAGVAWMWVGVAVGMAAMSVC